MPIKIVLIGAGSYVFAPTVLCDAIVQHRMSGELALVHLNLEAAEAMAGVGRRMAQDLDVDCVVYAIDDRRAALPDADYVILSAAPDPQSKQEREAALEGYTIQDAEPIYGDSLDASAAWGGKTGLAPLVGRPLRLRFVFRDADLYALRTDKVE